MGIAQISDCLTQRRRKTEDGGRGTGSPVSGLRSPVLFVMVLVGLASFAHGETGRVAWSPDGQTVAWAAPRGTVKVMMTEIWTARADGRDARRARTYLGRPGDLCFSPDGRELVYLQRSLCGAAFGAHLCGGHALPMIANRVWRIEADGAGEAEWPLPDELQPERVSVSPDGKRLAVAGTRGGTLAPPDPGLWAVDVDGRATRLLAGRVAEGALQWTPDGRHILCTISEPEGAQQVSVGLDGSTVAAAEVDTGRAARGGVPALDRFDPDAALRPVARAYVKETLAQVARAWDLYMRGYHAMHRGDYPSAKLAYNGAILALEGLLKRSAHSGISKADGQAYIRAIRKLIDMKEADYQRLCCAEHMLVLGDYVRQYAEAHGREIPDDLETLYAWLRDRAAEASDASVFERDVRMLSIVFHCAADIVVDRPASYAYSGKAPGEGPLLTCLRHAGYALYLTEALGRYGVTE